MDERGGVDHLDGGRQHHVVALEWAGDPGGQQQQGRPQPLAPQSDAVFYQQVDERMLAGELADEDFLDLLKLLLDGA